MSQRVTRIVHDRSVLQLQIRSLDDPTMEVVARADGRSWVFREPSWRDIGLGVCEDFICWWSARRLVALPSDGSRDMAMREVDEASSLSFGLTRTG